MRRGLLFVMVFALSALAWTSWRLYRENAILQARLSGLSAQPPPSAPAPPSLPAAPLPAAPIQFPAVRPAAAQSQGPPAVVTVEDTAALQQSHEKLAEAERSREALVSRITELESQLARSAEEGRRLAEHERELTENLNQATRKEAETRARFGELDQAAQRQKAQAEEDRRNAARATDVVTELQTINRRREQYLSSLMRRYRELTEQLRGAPSNGPDHARVQTLVAQAEDDLRQLNTLNAQALLVQKKLASR